MRTHFQKKNFERADRFLNQREPSPTEFCRYVAQAGTAHDGGNYIHYGKVHPSLEHLRTVSGLSEGVSSEAGFLAPGGWTDRILNHKWGSKIYQLCNLFKIEYNSMKMPHLDDTDRQNGLYKNFVIYPVSEASAITDTTLKFVANNLDLKKFVGLGAVTDELLQDFASLEQFLFDHFGRAFGWDIDRQIIRGAGHLEMLGLINSPAKIRIGKETGQDAATVLAENVKKMDARLVPEAHNTDSTVVLIHQTVKPQLIGLTETVGTAGGATPLYQFKRNGEQFDRLLGHPVIVSEHCSTIGSEGDIIFCSLDRFLIIQRAIRKQTSSHWLFLTDESAFRCVLRIDGQMDIAKPITPYGGGDTVSAVVTLADRS
jgi:HK97 family phage major capsid protein